MTTTGNGPSASAANSFNNLAAQYEKNTGGATRVIAKHLISLVEPISANARILDNACGTGIVIDELLASMSDPAVKDTVSVTCVDAAPAMIDLLKGKAATVWGLPDKHVEAKVLAAEQLDILPSDHYTHSFTNFGILFFGDPEKAAKDIYRTLVPGGKAYITTWKEIGYMRAVDEVQEIVRPGREKTTLPFDYVWFKGEHLGNMMSKAGFAEVEMHEYEGVWSSASVNSMADEFGGMLMGMMRGRGWTEEEAARLPQELKKALKDYGTELTVDEEGARMRVVANVAVCRK